MLGTKLIAFHEDDDLLFHRDVMFPPGAVTPHPNGVKFAALDAYGALLREQVYFSIGGGFIIADGESSPESDSPARPVPYPFASAEELLVTAADHRLSIAEPALANESALREADEIRAGNPPHLASHARLRRARHGDRGHPPPPCPAD